MKVKDPTGQTWRVTRRWVPWRRRLKGVMGNTPDIFPSGLGNDPISAVIAIVVLIIAIPFLLLFLVAALEALLLLTVLPIALLGRVLFGRHWTVEARRGFGLWWEEPAGDWQASALRIADVARAIEQGSIPERNLGVEPQEEQPEQ